MLYISAVSLHTLYWYIICIDRTMLVLLLLLTACDGLLLNGDGGVHSDTSVEHQIAIFIYKRSMKKQIVSVFIVCQELFSQKWYLTLHYLYINIRLELKINVISPGPFIQRNLNYLYLRMLCVNFGWKRPSCSGEKLKRKKYTDIRT